VGNNPFMITIFDKNFARQGWVGDPVEVRSTVRHNAIGKTDVVIPSDHRMLPRIAEDGSRCLITYRGEYLMSGYVTEMSGTGPSFAGLTTFTVTDDIWLIWRMLGWPAPAAAINAQGTKKDVRTGPAETVFKGFVSANRNHVIDQISVDPDLGSGNIITVESRMANLGDALVDQVDKGGVGIRVRQSGTGLLVSTYTPATFPHTLSELSGTVLDWTWSKIGPTSTRSIVGGPNEATSREFRRVIDTAREAAFGYTIESFVDARDADGYSDMDVAGTAALAEAGPKSGFSVTLSETKKFRYGPGGIRVGDMASIEIGGEAMTDVLREVTLTYTHDAGLEIAPAIGDHESDPNQVLARYIGNLARGVRLLRAR
jgi:hypothetical protein